MASGWRIGVDLGGTKITVCVLDSGGVERHRVRVATPAMDYGAILTRITDCVLEAERAVGRVCSVGVGTPGAVSAVDGCIKNSNTTCLIGQPLREDLAGRLARPIRIANDANCFALSEAVDGAGAGATLVFGVIVGTGTGGGLVIDGKVRAGRNAIAGEWGHNPLPWTPTDQLDARPCYCGQRGCVETFLSGPGLATSYRLRHGIDYKGREVSERASAGDVTALETLGDYAEHMARGLASVINLLDPDVIVLGGGLSDIEMLYEEVPRRWGAHVFSDRVDTALRRARHGDDSGVRGAAWLWAAEP